MVDNCVIELDGRKEFPINHGNIDTYTSKEEEEEEEEKGSDSTFLTACVTVIQNEFMAKDPEEVRFTFIALCSVTNDDN